MEKRSPDVHDDRARDAQTAPDVDRQSRRLAEARRRLAALARRTPDDVAAPPAPRAVTDELSALAQELTVAHEQLRHQTIELEQARQLLESERARFRELFEVSPEGHIITDSAGVVREANRGAAALLNMPVDYLVGKPLAVFIDAGRPAGVPGSTSIAHARRSRKKRGPSRSHRATANRCARSSP